LHVVDWSFEGQEIPSQTWSKVPFHHYGHNGDFSAFSTANLTNF